MTERLDDILSRRKFSTYKKIRKFLKTNIVKVNDVRVTNGGTQVNLKTDIITFNDKPSLLVPDIYIMLNKKANTLCANIQDKNKDNKIPLVFDFLPKDLCKVQGIKSPLHTVGRLDADTTGLLLLTTNGDFSHKLSMPSFHINKTYQVELKIPVTKQMQKEYIKKCSEGVFCKREGNSLGFRAKTAKLFFLEDNLCSLTIQEGKFHQVKRMFKSLGNEVAKLKRTAIGKLNLDETLQEGSWRFLTDTELDLVLL